VNDAAASGATGPAAERLSGPAALRLVDVTKEYALGTGAVRALDRLSLEVPAGQFIAVTGRSGSGKSTLLNLIAGIDTPTSGEVWVGSHELSRMDDDALTRLRGGGIGVIYQFFNLITTLSVRENIALPAMLAGRPDEAALAAADRLVEEIGLAPRAAARPHTLSGGEMQRVAIARALLLEPAVLLADEPTGNLDSRSAEQVLDLLRAAGERHGATVVLVTHSREAAKAARRVIELTDGRITADRPAAP
jgi:putative ABC transport system ATP-binding protein